MPAGAAGQRSEGIALADIRPFVPEDLTIGETLAAVTAIALPRGLSPA